MGFRLVNEENSDVKVLYRYHDYPSFVSYTGRYVHLETYKVIKETPKGYWISEYGDYKKWVSASTKKRFAYPTKEEALQGFIARKKRQVEILTSQLAGAKSALLQAELQTVNMDLNVGIK